MNNWTSQILYICALCSTLVPSLIHSFPNHLYHFKMFVPFLLTNINPLTKYCIKTKSIYCFNSPGPGLRFCRARRKTKYGHHQNRRWRLPYCTSSTSLAPQHFSYMALIGLLQLADCWQTSVLSFSWVLLFLAHHQLKVQVYVGTHLTSPSKLCQHSFFVPLSVLHPWPHKTLEIHVIHLASQDSLPTLSAHYRIWVYISVNMWIIRISKKLSFKETLQNVTSCHLTISSSRTR